MDLSTGYLGFSLSHPLMVGSSPLTEGVDLAKRLEDAGAAAIVMPSMFEEQITREEIETLNDMELPAESFAEALTYFPNSNFRLGSDTYLERMRKVKEAVSMPVIGSINGSTPRGWLRYASQIQEAGADALELNIYFLATKANESACAVEERTLDIIRGVREQIRIPLSVKLSPFYSSLPHVASQAVDAGADGLVLFNRFLQPDIDIEELEVQPSVGLSDSSELLLRIRWLAILSGQMDVDLACSGGVHTLEDLIKAVMAGASAVQLVSTVIQQGPSRIAELRAGLERWLEQHEYESLEQMRGSMNHSHCPDPEALERANYLRVLQGWRPNGLRMKPT